MPIQPSPASSASSTIPGIIFHLLVWGYAQVSMEFVWGLRVGISIFRYDWNLFAVHAQVSFFTHLCLGSTRKYHLTYSGWVGKVCMQGPLLREGWAGARARESKSPPQSSHEYMCIYIYIYTYIYILFVAFYPPPTHSSPDTTLLLVWNLDNY